jgi:hypothetical protein
VKRDLKDWNITKELALDKREWKIAIHHYKKCRFIHQFNYCWDKWPKPFIPYMGNEGWDVKV